MMNNPSKVVLAKALVRGGTALVGILFVVSGWNKLQSFEYVTGWVSSMGLPAPAFALGAAIALELVAGTMLLVGWRTRWAAMALAAFLVPTTLVFHAFWVADAAQVQDQLTAFLKNVAIFGAMLLILAPTGLVAGEGDLSTAS